MSDERQTRVLRNLARDSNDGVLRGPALDAADRIDRDRARIEELEAREKRMRHALELYAHGSWGCRTDGNAYVEQDGVSYQGQIARAALYEDVGQG